MTIPLCVTIVVRDASTTAIDFLTWARRYYGNDVAEDALVRIIAGDDGSGGLREKMQAALEG